MRQEIRTTTTLWRAGIVAQIAHRARALINARMLMLYGCVSSCVLLLIIIVIIIGRWSGLRCASSLGYGST
eukprot:COSAG06_NODE_6324_length_2983_cov_1.503121_2_plen_71_part_00